ncbi:MAG: hypothetical protein QHH13_04170 [Melioribacter sp.]|uniref:hypothetical protein n=1 Tax=Rosettibacter primus TaxID=3111523 RepID=UPI00247E1BA9|nr:hypothetical protein [Melioribacter sp.]
MKQNGIITKVIENKKIFFIDDKYFCHFNKVDFSPKEGDHVMYIPHSTSEGKLEAKEVKRLKSDWDIYLESLENGYFDEEGKIKKEFVIDFPIILASIFSKERGKDLNKPTQIMKWFSYCKNVEGIYKLKKDFGEVKVSLWKLISYSNDALGRKKISEKFQLFLYKNINLATLNPNNFLKGFMQHFEAFIGFFRNKKGE